MTPEQDALARRILDTLIQGFAKTHAALDRLNDEMKPLGRSGSTAWGEDESPR